MPIIELADKQHNDKKVKKLRGTMACVVQLKRHENHARSFKWKQKALQLRYFKPFQTKK